MSYIEESVNEYGTPISVFKCDTCGDTYTLCPAIPENKRDQWQNCMADICPSYDPNRDVLMLVHLGAELNVEPVED